MDLTDYLRVLRKRWRLITAATLVGLVAATAATLLMTPRYEATTQLFVSTQGGEDASALLQGSSFTQQRVKSYSDVVTSPAVLRPVIAQLGLETSPADLAERVTASAPLDTVLIDVTVSDETPAVAADIADAVAVSFVAVVTELEQPAGDAPSPVRVSVTREALVPEGPVSPRVPLNLALGLLVGLAAGAGVAVLRELLDTSLRTTDDVTGLGLPVLGSTLLAAPKDGGSVLVTGHTNTPQSEALRQIRTNLQFVDLDNPQKVVVVTSSVPGEGKTTTSVNLALTLAMAGVRTVLVEADLRLPKVSEYLGLEGAAGLTTVLTGQADLDDVLQPYGTSGLSVLPSGVIPPNPSELLGSRQMADLVAGLRERAEVVVVDSPPLLPVTDAAVLSRHVDGAIVVVRHGRTTRDQLTKALERLRSVDGRVLGGVLSMVPAASAGEGYGYGYGYGYGEPLPEQPAVAVPVVPAVPSQDRVEARDGSWDADGSTDDAAGARHAHRG